MKNISKYDLEIRTVCKYCGKTFKYLSLHIRQKHKVSVLDYKKEFGIDRGLALMDDEVFRKKSISAKENKKGIENLLKYGKNTRIGNIPDWDFHYSRRQMTSERLSALGKKNGGKITSLQAHKRRVTRSKTSKYRGVILYKKGVWRSAIRAHGKYYYLGTFHKEKEAAKAYNKKAIELFGSDAVLNNVK